MAIYFENNMPLIQAKKEMADSIMIRRMIDDTWTFANPVTPMKDGGLRASVNRRMESPKRGYIEWTVPYASYQDRGMRADGTYVIKHHTTAGTHERFASESIAKVLARLPYYANLEGMLL